MAVLRENARISKQNLNKLIKGIKGGLYFEETKTVCSCVSSCPYKDANNLYKEYCELYCNNKETLIEIKKVDTIKQVKELSDDNGNAIGKLEMEYVIKGHDFIRPSKSVIKQYIFYHFLVSDECRVRKNITAKMVAEELNISIATVKRNNKLLQDLGFIHLRKVTPAIFDIFIYGEEKLHFKKSEGGTGYITLPKGLYERIKDLTDVNIVRIELKKILKADADKNLKREVSPNISEIRANSIVEILPYYLRRAKKKLNEKILSEHSILKVVQKESNKDIYQMNIADYKTSEAFGQEFIANTMDALHEFIETNGLNVLPTNSTLFGVTEDTPLSEEQDTCRKALYWDKLTDLAQLSLEYGTQTIRDILIYIKHRYIEIENIEIKNIGAFVRTLIKYFISLEGSNFTIAI